MRIVEQIGLLPPPGKEDEMLGEVTGGGRKGIYIYRNIGCFGSLWRHFRPDAAAAGELLLGHSLDFLNALMAGVEALAPLGHAALRLYVSRYLCERRSQRA